MITKKQMKQVAEIALDNWDFDACRDEEEGKQVKAGLEYMNQNPYETDDLEYNSDLSDYGFDWDALRDYANNIGFGIDPA